MDILDTLKQLTSVTGVSGAECGAAESALGLLKKYAPDASIDASGNVTGLIRSGVPGAKTLMLDAHIDQIGLIVTYIDKNGFLKVGSCGGPDLKIMLAQSVTVHGSQSCAELSPRCRRMFHRTTARSRRQRSFSWISA